MDPETVADKIFTDVIVSELMSQLSPEKQQQVKDRVFGILEATLAPPPASPPAA